MSTIIHHRPQELRKITDRIRMQVAAGTVMDATEDVLAVALLYCKTDRKSVVQ